MSNIPTRGKSHDRPPNDEGSSIAQGTSKTANPQSFASEESAKIAKEFREEGKKCINETRYDEGIVLYTLAIMKFPTSDAYSDRAFAHLQQKK